MSKPAVVKKFVFRRPLPVVRPKKHELTNHLALVPALMFLEGAWVRTQVYLKITENGRRIYLCPLCVSSNLATELVTSKEIGVIRFKGRTIKLKVRLPTHQCPNCKVKYAPLKGRGEFPLDDLETPFVHA